MGIRFVKRVFKVKSMQSSLIAVDITEDKTVQNEDENFVGLCCALCCLECRGQGLKGEL